MSDAGRENGGLQDPQQGIVNSLENTLALSYGPAADLTPGQIIEGKYKVLGELGRGGMGVVYRVEQLALGRVLAMKMLNQREVTDVTWRRFQVEAKAAAMLDHPNLITVHDCGLINNEIPFFIMDYIEGTNLSNLIKDKGALSLEETLTIFIQACFGLAYAHTVGIVHRDLKPSNIMLVPPQSDSSGLSIRVVDFGIAKLTAEEIQPTQALTRTGEIFGSPLYMSPEQCMGKPVDKRSDIYSLGCVMFECLAGVPPFFASTALSTMMQHQSTQHPSLKEATLGKEFPPEIEKIIAMMLEKNPDSRYQDMKTIARDLSLLHQGISLHPLVSVPTKEETRARTKKFTALQTVAALALGAVVGGAATYHVMDQRIGSSYKKGYGDGELAERDKVSRVATIEEAHGGPISTISVDKNGRTMRTFNFGSPKGFGMGYIRLVDKDKSIPAKGVLTFPADEPLGFDVEDKVIVTDPKFLLRFNSNEFTELRFRFNFGVSDSTFTYLDRQKNLKFLDLTACEVSEQLIDTLNKLPKLQGLKVAKTHMGGLDLLRLKRLNQLRILNMAGLPGQADVLRKLKGSPMLRELRISAELLKPQDFQLLGTFKNLNSLWIEKAAKITNGDTTWISDLPNLSSFLAEDSQITCDRMAAIVSKLPKLRSIGINDKLWSEKDVARFKREFPKVKIANLD